MKFEYLFLSCIVFVVLLIFASAYIGGKRNKSNIKTKIVVTSRDYGKGKWDVVKEYDFLITLTDKDTIEVNDIEYRVDYCFLDIKENTMHILIK